MPADSLELKRSTIQWSFPLFLSGLLSKSPALFSRFPSPAPAVSNPTIIETPPSGRAPSPWSPGLLFGPRSPLEVGFQEPGIYSVFFPFSPPLHRPFPDTADGDLGERTWLLFLLYSLGFFSRLLPDVLSTPTTPPLAFLDFANSPVGTLLSSRRKPFPIVAFTAFCYFKICFCSFSPLDVKGFKVIFIFLFSLPFQIPLFPYEFIARLLLFLRCNW